MSASPASSASSGFNNLAPRRKRVTAEHTLNRVRENQRRHRARRKDHIATLEQKLAETEKQLEEAREEIARLRSERETTQAQGQSQWNVGLIFQEGTLGATANQQNDTQEISNELRGVLTRRPNTTTTTENIPNPLAPSPSIAIVANIANPPGPPPCCLDETSSIPPTADEIPDPNDPECRSCKTRPAPAPTESTTLCSQAYVLIAQQNFRGIDAPTIRKWLFQGFRRARRKGEGCSIENTALMSLLDFISGCEERVGVPCGHQQSGGLDEPHDHLFGL
ncbi:hypothetical protein BU24DRAFT_427695 [Aaosphaeria arxii CBS 175.79]|uniref:BZIP domain-containing protein n=1 Tax=Aaosphaeria arxii CBS 175.79 TaxID=1450172 RepID=A0A6A5XC62_9PLEO|nr:uncharacterized protein BU24DRAFT_427695 [Aaosphaeria arxii CBS 175.79]KAF2010582.1 hypothetical protein BU24DRAFT_427695 [Aaosphaeria arxii CBS 175.79]